jgi:exosome complex component RRP4
MSDEFVMEENLEESKKEAVPEALETVSEEAPKRRLVIPGDLLGSGIAGHGAYEENGKVFSKYIGLAEEKNSLFFVIPLSGIYNPKRGDGVIGKIEEISFSKWIVDINSPYQAVLPLNEAVDEFIDLTKTDLTRYFDYGDIIFAEISTVTKTKNVQLSMKNRKCRKLRGGRLIKVTPAKVPRIIGKAGSMVEMIKELTGTQIVVGQNGIVWVKGENEGIATEAILVIEQRSHVHGLTDQIKEILEKKLSHTVKPKDNIENKEVI